MVVTLISLYRYQAPVYIEQPRQQQVPPPQRQPRRPPAQFQQLEYEGMAVVIHTDCGISVDYLAS
jgi:hypothetical protein